MSESTSGGVSVAAETGEATVQQPVAEVAELKGIKSKAAREYYMKNIAGKGAEAAQTAEPGAEEKTPTEEVNTQQEQTQEVKKATFDELLADDDYKAEFDQKVQAVLNKRFKTAKAAEERMDKLAPLIDIIGKKYGIDTQDLSKLDIDGLVKKVTDDDIYYEAEAMEKGMSVEALKAVRKLENENTSLRRTEAQREAEKQQRENEEAQRRDWLRISAQAQEVKNQYPGFDLRTEINDPNTGKRFAQLLHSGVDVRTAYEVLHKDQIIPAAMQYATQQTQAALAASIASGQKRPTESGAVTSAPAQTTIDVSKLSRKERQDYITRAQRGEKITFK